MVMQLGNTARRQSLRLATVLIPVCLFLGCQGRTPEKPTTPDQASPRHLSGLHNVYRITDRLYSGSSPEGDEGFQSLKELGVKTVISVDGAKPEVEHARKFGLRYVHLPFGYDGIPRQRVLELAKAVRDLPAPIYLHCHHGKHRGPAAAAAIHLCLDEKCGVDQAIAEMKRAGTDPHYTGLYQVAKELARPTNAELNQLPVDFPEVAKVPDLAQIMVEIDTRWDDLKLTQAAGWKTPPKHADLDPAHEALQLLEQYREACRLKIASAELQRGLAEAEKETAELLRSLRANEKDAAEQAARKVAASCTHCHAKFRDVPRQ
jgi:protein tyrosine phosphatase (PTP) superfamily phosphohydrolase (DUF442 family)